MTYETFINELNKCVRGSVEWHRLCAEWLGRERPAVRESSIIASVAEESD